MRAVVVIGGDGFLATALVDELLSRQCRVLRTSRRPTVIPHREGESTTFFDMRDPRIGGLAAKMGTGDVVVYIMAAITGIMRCETDPDAWRVNAEAPALIARRAQELGWFPVFVSSGTVERAQHTALARQKAFADLAVLMSGGCVVRPLPYVTEDRLNAVACLLVAAGEEKWPGVVRWEG